MLLVPDLSVLVGPTVVLQRSVEVQWLLDGPEPVLLLAAGDRPDGSAVADILTVRVRGPFPDPVAALTEVTVVLDLAGQWWSLGAARPTMTVSDRYGRLSELELTLDEELTDADLDLVRPVDAIEWGQPQWPALLGPDRTDAALGFLQEWWGAAGSDPVDAPVPAPLRAVHRAAAGNATVLGGHDRLLPLPGESDDDGWIAFAEENQGVFVLSHGAGADPAVRCRFGNETFDEQEPLSGVLLQFLLRQAAVTARFGVWGAVAAPEFDQLRTGMLCLELAPASWLGEHSTFAVGPGLVVCASRTPDHGYYVTAGARHPAALQRFRDAEVEWDLLNY